MNKVKVGRFADKGQANGQGLLDTALRTD